MNDRCQRITELRRPVRHDPRSLPDDDPAPPLQLLERGGAEGLSAISSVVADAGLAMLTAVTMIVLGLIFVPT
jgi:hypothetical protein